LPDASASFGEAFSDPGGAGSSEIDSVSSLDAGLGAWYTAACCGSLRLSSTPLIAIDELGIELSAGEALEPETKAFETTRGRPAPDAVLNVAAAGA
jgi:hypothetical protein